MHQREYDQRVYQLAEEYLLQLSVEGVTPDLIERYLRHPNKEDRPMRMSDIFERMLGSAQSGGMNPKVVGDAIGGVDKLGLVLFEFTPAKVLDEYQENWEYLLDEIENKLKPTGKIRRTPRSIWPNYCKTILSSATFLDQFTSAVEFYEWIDFFDQDDRARPALPLLLSQEVAGFGFALACDFLLELGYENFAKPDVHIRDIFTELKLCAPKANDYQVFKAVIRVAANAGLTPYTVDKLFWLIGSGYFYDDKHIGNSGRTGSHKAKFITAAKQSLGV